MKDSKHRRLSAIARGASGTLTAWFNLRSHMQIVSGFRYITYPSLRS